MLLYSSGQLPMPFNKATILREWDYHCIKRSVSRTIVLDDFCFEGSVVRWYAVEVNFHIWINNLTTKQKINAFSQKKINSWATTSLPMYQNTSFELTEKPSKRRHIWILSYLAFCARFAFGISRLWKLLGRNHLKNKKSKSPLNVLKKNSSLLLITVIFDHSESAGPVSRKSRELFGPEKPFLKLPPAYSVKPVFWYVVKGILFKITAKFRASRRLCSEDTKGIMSPEMHPKSFGTFEKRAPDQRIHTIFSLSPINTTLAHNDEKAGHDWCVAPNFLWPFYYSHRLTGWLHDRIERLLDVERRVQSVIHSARPIGSS